MHGLLFALLAVSAAPAQPPARETAASASKCVEGTPEPSSAGNVRPMQTGRCPYDVHGAYARLLALLGVKEGRIDLAYVERLFGLPRLYTAYDDPLVDYHAIFLTGGAADSVWKGVLTFHEGFSPLQTRPQRSQGSMRPRHVRKGERGDIRLSIQLFPLVPAQPWRGCVTLSEFERRALAAGWSHPEGPPMQTNHGEPPPLILERRGLSLSPWGGEGACLAGATIHQEADPPIRLITESE